MFIISLEMPEGSKHVTARTLDMAECRKFEMEGYLKQVPSRYGYVIIHEIIEEHKHIE